MSEKERPDGREGRIILLICLIVMQGTAFYYYGPRTAVLGILSVFVCTAVNYLCMKIRRIMTYDILSVVIAGLELSVMMSAAAPFYVAVMTGIFGIGLIRHAFGGADNEIFHPACTAYLFAEVCFPAILAYPKPFSDIPVLGEYNGELLPSLASAVQKGTASEISVFELSVGSFPSPMGLGSAALIGVIAVFFFAKRISSWEAFLPMTAVYGAASYIIGGYHDLKYNLLLGMYIFCGVFFICRALPEKPLNKVLIGLAAGIFTVIFRYAGNLENPAVYAAVLTAPAAAILKDREKAPKNDGGDMLAGTNTSE